MARNRFILKYDYNVKNIAKMGRISAAHNFYNDFTSTCNTFSEIEIPLSLRYYLTLDGSALNCLMSWLIAQTFRIMFDNVLTLISRQEQ